MGKLKLSVFSGKYFVLSAIILAGLALRLYGLNAKSLWYDEACSLNLSAYNIGEIFTDPNINDPIPKPLYFILLKAWTAVFGFSEIATRMLSVLFGVLSILLIYKLGKILFNKETGLCAAFLLSISSYNIYYSQQVRYYSIFLFLSLISMFLYFKMIKNKDKLRKLSLSYILANALIFYIFPYGLYIIIIQILNFLIFAKKNIVANIFMKVQFVLWLLFLPGLITYFFNEISTPGTIERLAVPMPGFMSLWETFEVFGFGGFRQGHAGVGFCINPERLVYPRILGIVLAVLFLAGVFLVRWNKPLRDKGGSNILFLWFWMFFTIFGFYLSSALIGPTYLNRYFLPLSAAYYLAVSVSIIKLKKLKFVIIPVIAILTVFSLSALYNPGSDNDWRKLSAHLKNDIKQNDLILLAPLDQIIPFWYYYKYDGGCGRRYVNNIDNMGGKFYHRYFSSFLDGNNRVIGFGLEAKFGDIQYYLEHFTQNSNDIWLIISPYWIGADRTALFKNRLSREFDIRESRYFDYDGVEVIHYSPKKIR